MTSRNVLIIILLIFLPPIGILVVLLSGWKKEHKALAASLSTVLFMLSLIISALEEPRPVNEPSLAETAEEVPNVANNEEIEAEAETEIEEDFYTVISVQDGDTLTVAQNNEEMILRLACIDAPESEQAPHGERAKLALETLAGEQVGINIVDVDRYDRQVAEIYTPGGNFINLRMVEAGNAAVYAKYLSNCGDENATNLTTAEEQARAEGKGIWGDANFVMPWDYRDGVRVEIPEPEPAAEIIPAPTNLPSCVNSDCNCSDFSTWRQAQDVLESSPGDPHRLDRDKDGVACESLQ